MLSFVHKVCCCILFFLASFCQAQIPLRTGITSPILECPPPSTQGGKLNAWQEACDMQFKICSSSPEMIPRAGSKYTLTSTKTSMCELCWADLYTCYSDCRIPGPPVTFNKMCNDACAPLFAYVCTGQQKPQSQ
jgi:hypothetical protein